MTIEMHTPHEGLQENIVRLAKQGLIRLSQNYKGVSRMECSLKECSSISPTENKVCEIRVMAYGENLFTHARTDDYETAASEAIDHISQQVALLASRENELPDNITSTVKV